MGLSQERRADRFGAFVTVLLAWLLSMCIVLVGVAVGYGALDNATLDYRHDRRATDDYLNSMIRMDGLNYLRIVEDGYDYQADKRSMVAFFPLYPQFCALLARHSAYRSEFIMVAVGNLALLAVFALFHWYGQLTGAVPETPRHPDWSLAAFCFFPSAFFLRMPYAESLLCLFMLLCLIGMVLRWPLAVIAIFAGIACATRPVGIAVAVAVWWYALISRQRSPSPPAPLSLRDWVARCLQLVWIIPLSCWGLLAYMAYLWHQFDTPLAFAQTQEHWSFSAPINGTVTDKLWSLITFEPIWNVYNPNSERFWRNGDFQSNPLNSCLFWNPIFYLFAWFLIGLGWWKKWLKDYEIVLSVGLLLIPYVTRAYEMSMASHARFASVVIPQYFVLGRLFTMMPPAIAGCLCGLMGLMMGLWTALFVAGYRFF